MPLKFDCPNCGKEVYVKYLKKGEVSKCAFCGTLNAVPETAQEVSLHEAAEFAGKLGRENVEKFSAHGGLPADEVSRSQKTHMNALRVCAWITIVVGILFAVILLIMGIAYATREYGTELGPVFILYGILAIFPPIAMGVFMLVISAMAENLMAIRMKVNDLCNIARNSDQTG